jgi:hypothetical protein
VPEKTLQQGEIITIQFDRPTAFLGLELTQESALRDAMPGLGLIAPQQDLDDDFSAGTYVVEFVVSTVSGITTAAVTALVSKVLTDRKKNTDLKIIVQSLPVAPEDNSLRLGVTCEDRPPEVP